MQNSANQDPIKSFGEAFATLIRDFVASTTAKKLDQFVSAKNCAQLTGCTWRTLLQARRRGELEGRGTTPLTFKLSIVEEWLAARAKRKPSATVDPYEAAIEAQKGRAA